MYSSELTFWSEDPLYFKNFSHPKELFYVFCLVKFIYLSEIQLKSLKHKHTQAHILF